MIARLLILMLAFIFQNQALANKDTRAKTPVKVTRDGMGSDYSEFNSVSLLVDNPSTFDRNKAFLAIDKNGKPAVYPLFNRQINCVMLGKHSSTDILAHWGPAKKEGAVYNFTFSYWKDGTWKPAQVDLKFRENYCSRFRVVADDAKIQNWLPAKAIPSVLDEKNPDGTLKLPLFIGVVEGPRDSPDCGVRPISDQYANSLREGKCPLGLSK